MPPRVESIFKIGEEKVEEELNMSSRVLTTSSREAPESRLVGLRILIEHHRLVANVVTKSTLKSPASEGRHPRSLPELGYFLKACMFCKKELSLEKDVYMYRGDQGFCSMDCRCQQILLDERREFEASKREWRRMQHHHHSHTPMSRESNQRRWIKT